MRTDDNLASILEAIYDGAADVDHHPNHDDVADGLRVEWSAGAIAALDFESELPESVPLSALTRGQRIRATNGWAVASGYVGAITHIEGRVEPDVYIYDRPGSHGRAALTLTGSSWEVIVLDDLERRRPQTPASQPADGSPKEGTA